MKLKTIKVTAVASVKGGNGRPGEDREARENRMKALWSDAENSTLYVMGKLLANKQEQDGVTLTLAQWLLKGEVIDMETVTAPNGVILPLREGFSLSLKNVGQWGCPACHSAHGTGVAPSRESSQKGLEKNTFFYNPKTKHLFTISESCWSDYVVGLGAVKDTGRFIDVPSEKPAPTVEKGKGKNTAPAMA